MVCQDGEGGGYSLSEGIIPAITWDTKQTTQDLSQDGQSLCHDSAQVPTKYTFRALPLHQPAQFLCSYSSYDMNAN
jgi:hypothetical protein